MALAIIWGGAILGTKRPQPFDGRGKLAERIEVEFRPFALLLHRVEPNAFWSLCPRSGFICAKDLLLWSQAQPAQRGTLELIPRRTE